MSELFWLSDRQWAVIEPHLPKVHTGPVRCDDRRILSGILYVLKEGCRWRGLPKEYGPRTTVYNRYNRWSRRGLWQRLLAALVGAGAAPEMAMIDSSAVKAHLSASGGKGGRASRPSAAHAAGAQRRSTRSSMTKADRMRSS